jgi:hypothetical protein
MSTRTGQRSSGVGFGVLLLGLALLVVTNWWWPGVMLVLGVALAAERLIRGRYRAAAVVAVVFIAVPLLISFGQSVHVRAGWLVGLVLAALGVAVLVRTLARSDGRGAPSPPPE